MSDQITNFGVARSQSGSGHELPIEWVEKYPDLRPNVMYFECARLSAYLTKDACGKNFEAAHQKATDETPLRLLKCRGCNMGRSLHTDSDAPQSWVDVRNPGSCVRCGRSDLRLIPSASTCVSCFNRERESRIGKNARGRMPQTMVILSPRRVGLAIDGKPVWRRFAAWHEVESLSRAIRQIDGAKFHPEQPGKSVWNARVGRFQYRCSLHGGELSTLVERRNDDGTTEYICPVCRPAAAKSLPEAMVTASVSFSSPGFVKELLAKLGDVELAEYFTPVSFICDRCSHYQIEVRKRGSRVECRCPACDATH